jgi:type I restriction enzyme M protein
MAVKKSELYSSLWASCDELRGGMDASQYKDYVLFMLFIKYVSDKYGDYDGFEPPVVIPKGASFKDMVALKGDSDIGNKINTQVIQPLIDANSRLARSDFPDFNDSNKLGDGAAKVERLGNLIAIFENPALDFSKNRAEHDDILGDAYEYLMRHFATESGKSKGQFYTPSEVSRIMAKVIGISPQNTKASTTAYDPTCGSGSLLLKVAAEAGKHITLEGQEKDVTNAGLARMNMILHDFPTANVLSGNTLFDPKFKDGEQLRTYDYVVANPPFSDKTWSTGLSLGESGKGDKYQRFTWGVPPKKQGDYAYLLHIIRSMKSTGKAACILPHGVLSRGNAEAAIRQQLVRSGYLKAIIGLPANLFYGTGIPACIVVLDKENATTRKGIFMIDASKGFMKDGPKNRLRDQDIHKIVDTFHRQDESDTRYARMVPVEEIADEKNDYNLNLPRYIDSTEPEDLQDIDGHLRGGIAERDVDALGDYWKIMPGLRATLFEKFTRPGYCRLRLPIAEVKPAIFAHAEFTAFHESATRLFTTWKNDSTPLL